MNGLRSIVPLPKESLRGVDPSSELGQKPTFEWVDPRELYVEERYQRGPASEGSTNLVRKIVGGFRWSKFKPPIVVRLEGGKILFVIDGQHTAIGAATHPKVGRIPVMIVGADEIELRADAFVAHNHDRLVMTNLALYRGQVVAGHEEATAIDAAVRAAGALILEKHTSTRDKLPVGATTAIGTIRSIYRRKGAEHVTRALKVLVDAERAPMLGEEIAAVSLVLGRVEAKKLSQIISSRNPLAWRSAATVRRGESGDKPAPALAAVWALADDGKAAPRPAPRAPPLSPPHAKPATPKPVAAPPPRRAVPTVVVDPKAPEARKAEFNGVAFDLAARTVTRGGKTFSVDDDGVRMLSALARAMPGWIPSSTLYNKTFGPGTIDPVMLYGEIKRINAIAAVAGLEVRPSGTGGYVLAELDLVGG